MPTEMLPYGKSYHIECMIQSSKRVRSLLYFIIVFSILILATVWNSRPNNLLNKHIRIASDAYAIMNAQQSTQTAQSFPNLPEKREIRAKNFLKDNRKYFPTPESLDEYVSLLRDKQLSRLYDDGAPVFGIKLPVSDLGIIGGLGFIALLTLLRFVMARYAFNLRLVFDEVKSSGKLAPYFRILRMQQVLFVPNHEDYPGNKAWQAVPYLLLALPVLSQLTIVARDALYPPGYQREIMNAVGPICLVIVFFLSLSCCYLLRRTSQDWTNREEQLSEKKELRESLLGRWLYKVEYREQSYSHSGDCHIKTDGMTIRFEGTRRVVIESDKHELAEVRNQWRSTTVWTKDQDQILFEYSITAGDAHIDGYCRLSLVDENFSRLEGQYFQLPPTTSNGRYGRIIFKREEDLSKTHLLKMP